MYKQVYLSETNMKTVDYFICVKSMQSNLTNPLEDL